MKILLINLLLSYSAYSTDIDGTTELGYNVEELLAEIENPVMTMKTQQKVKIVDAEGNVVREILKSSFDMNEMSADEHMTISQSSYMFEYLGDSYYLMD